MFQHRGCNGDGFPVVLGGHGIATREYIAGRVGQGGYNTIYNTIIIQYNFIAKCQYTDCTRIVTVTIHMSTLFALDLVISNSTSAHRVCLQMSVVQKILD